MRNRAQLLSCRFVFYLILYLKRNYSFCAYLNDQVINDILQCNIRNINVKYNSNKIIKFKSAVAWEQAMFSRHINLRTIKDALLKDQRFLSTFHRNGVTEHNFGGSFHAKNKS